MRPARFLPTRLPLASCAPHCLKKKATPTAIAGWRAGINVVAHDLGGLRHRHDVPATVIRVAAHTNAKDYTRAVRPESMIRGMLTDAADLRGVKRTLPRSNSRGIYKGDDDDAWIERHPVVLDVADWIEQTRSELGKTSGCERMYHGVTRLYFGGMAQHFASLRNSLKPGAWLAYVVGDQASYLRVMIRTAGLLAEIAETLGYAVVGKNLFRTREATATRSQLNEEMLVLRWPRRCRRPDQDQLPDGKPWSSSANALKVRSRVFSHNRRVM